MNLLPNPGFEETTGKLPTHYTDLRVYYGAGGDKVEVSSDPNGRTGRCLKISTREASDCGIAISVPVKKNTRYRLSGWIKTEDIRTVRNSPGVMMNIHGGQRTKGLKGTTDWTEVSVEFESGRDRVALIHCLFGGYGGAKGTAWFDDISLVALSSTNNLAGAIASLREYAGNNGREPVAIERTHTPDPEVHKRGEAVYSLTCVACHGVDGKGVPETFPPLDGSGWVTGDPAIMTKIVLHGLIGGVEVSGHTYNNVMAPLGAVLNDQQVSDVLTYVRQSWTNDAPAVPAEAVRDIRAATKGRVNMWTQQELRP